MRNNVLICAGADECGTGALAGPIVAACVVLAAPDTDLDGLRGQWPLAGVNDSKKLTDLGRRRMAKQLYAMIVEWGGEIGFGEARVWEINKFGHAVAWNMAMDRAISNAAEGLFPELLIIDGVVIPRLSISTTVVAEPKADTNFFHVAAASILGKVYRDDLMLELAKQFEPQFPSWGKNMGYATQTHIAELQKHGLTVHHREQASATALGTQARKREGW